MQQAHSFARNRPNHITAKQLVHSSSLSHHKHLVFTPSLHCVRVEVTKWHTQQHQSVHTSGPANAVHVCLIHDHQLTNTGVQVIGVHLGPTIFEPTIFNNFQQFSFNHGTKSAAPRPVHVLINCCRCVLDTTWSHVVSPAYPLCKRHCPSHDTATCVSIEVLITHMVSQHSLVPCAHVESHSASTHMLGRRRIITLIYR